jgi:hypothetical protein
MVISIYFRLSSQAITSAFSCALQARLRVSLQLRRNHFSTFAASVKRSALAFGARAEIGLSVLAWRPAWVGFSVWHEAQLHSPPCLLTKKRAPRSAEAGLPASFSKRVRKSRGVSARVGPDAGDQDGGEKQGYQAHFSLQECRCTHPEANGLNPA